MPEFDNKHVVFGEVLEGFEHVQALANIHGSNQETGEIPEGSNRILDAEEYFDEEFPDHRPEIDQPTKRVKIYHDHLPEHQQIGYEGPTVDHEEWLRLHTKSIEEKKKFHEEEAARAAEAAKIV
jgi:hypothetical protein